MQKNILGQPLDTCSHDPITGFYRDGCCRSGEDDRGQHSVCVKVTGKFLQFSSTKGNDLSTPRPEFNFPGLTPGDCWCLCLARWVEAYQADCAPEVILEATHESALQAIPLEIWLSHGVSKDNLLPH
ncbi:MAG: DUF2237 domain-containing protein [Myxococcota bacterium]|nr:DUF2237 domain-containing protein [Myxococcota bacterium]